MEECVTFLDRCYRRDCVGDGRPMLHHVAMYSRRTDVHYPWYHTKPRRIIAPPAAVGFQNALTTLLLLECLQNKTPECMPLELPLRCQNRLTTTTNNNNNRHFRRWVIARGIFIPSRGGFLLTAKMLMTMVLWVRMLNRPSAAPNVEARSSQSDG
ncbi:hypothetical protein LY76DRAFT_101973 [Colletotrichum caudatum]|nr:hypothetical protein LY76DRAFT_101973 [Colletotrichum caudatum]